MEGQQIRAALLAEEEEEVLEAGEEWTEHVAEQEPSAEAEESLGDGEKPAAEVTVEIEELLPSEELAPAAEERVKEEVTDPSEHSQPDEGGEPSAGPTAVDETGEGE
jgi:hypothetical protein